MRLTPLFSRARSSIGTVTAGHTLGHETRGGPAGAPRSQEGVLWVERPHRCQEHAQPLETTLLPRAWGSHRLHAVARRLPRGADSREQRPACAPQHRTRCGRRSTSSPAAGLSPVLRVPPSTVGFVPTRFGAWADQTPRCGRFWLLVSVVTESLYIVCSSFSECSVGSCRASLPRSSINHEIRHSDEQDLTAPSFTNLTEVHVVNGKCEPRGDRG